LPSRPKARREQSHPKKAKSKHASGIHGKLDIKLALAFWNPFLWPRAVVRRWRQRNWPAKLHNPKPTRA
jgi:hypothetical protein